MTDKVYSLLKVKSVDARKRIIRGIASTPSTDRAGDSVVPEGMQVTLPVPCLDSHDARSPLGSVISARANKDGVYCSIQFAEENTSARIDEQFELVRQGVLRGLSIGFRGLDTEPTQTGGLLFKSWELMEISVCAVPCNAEATITDVRKAFAATPAASTEIPPYPRHLDGDARTDLKLNIAKAIRRRAVSDKIMKLKGYEAMLFDLIGSNVIENRWQGERIKALEEQIAALTGETP